MSKTQGQIRSTGGTHSDSQVENISGETKTQKTFPVPAPSEGMGLDDGGHWEYLSLHYRVGSSSQPAALPHRQIIGSLDQKHFDIIFLKTNFERGTQNRARLSWAFPWTYSCILQTRGEGHMGSCSVARNRQRVGLLTPLDLNSSF